MILLETIRSRGVNVRNRLRFRSKSVSVECGESCRQRRRELELEAQQLRRDVKSAEDRLRTMDVEIQHLRRSQQTTPPQPQQQQQQQHQMHHQQQHHQHHHQQQQPVQQHNVETELLVSALASLQDKTSHLESSLSEETRVKLDLFSALGKAKRQLEHHESKADYLLTNATDALRAAIDY